MTTTGDQAKASRDDDERALKRIVRLSGGGALRGIVRKADGQWEIKRGSEWSPLPDAAIAEVVLERELVSEFKTRRKAARKAEDARASEAALVAWAFGSGLLQEGLDLSESVLQAEPDHQGTRDVLIDHAHLFSVPRAVPMEDGGVTFEPILRWASLRSSSLRELAVLRLAEGGDRDTLREQIAQNLVHTLPTRRSFAALTMARLFPGEGVKALLVRAVLDTSPDVRASASRALGAVGEPGLVVPVLRALETSNSARVRIQAAEALGNMGYTTAVEPLIARLSALRSAAAAGGAGSRVPHSHIFVGRQFAYIQDFDVEVAQFQAVADPQVNVLIEGEVLDAGVVMTYEENVVGQRAAIQRSLKRLTGENPGGRAKDWVRWWEENEPRWREHMNRRNDPGD